MDVSWVVGIASAAQTTTSSTTTTTAAASTTTTAAAGGGGPTAETATIAALAVIIAGVFGFLGARGAAKLTSTASREAAKITSGSQLAVIQQQLDDAAFTRAQERRFALIDRRLKRHEETILKLQDALAGLAVAVKTLARARSSKAATKRPQNALAGLAVAVKTLARRSSKAATRPPGWEEPLDEQHTAVDSAFQEAYKLLQRLPRGSQVWTADWAETWTNVEEAVDGHRRSVLASKDEAEQKDQLQRFEDAIHYAHDQLGQALERLDEEIQRNLREEENALSQQQKARPAPTQQETKPD
jgi:hypothetical protein